MRLLHRKLDHHGLQVQVSCARAPEHEGLWLTSLRLLPLRTKPPSVLFPFTQFCPLHITLPLLGKRQHVSDWPTCRISMPVSQLAKVFSWGNKDSWIKVTRCRSHIQEVWMGWMFALSPWQAWELEVMLSSFYDYKISHRALWPPLVSTAGLDIDWMSLSLE